MRELSKEDIELIDLVKLAMEYEDNGDNMSDVIEDYQVIEALQLLVDLASQLDKGDPE